MNQTPPQTPRKRRSLRAFFSRHKRPVIFLGSVFVFLLLIMLMFWTEPPAPTAETNVETVRVRTVSVTTVTAGQYAAEIEGFAEVYPRWTSTLRAQVSGTLVSVAGSFQPGARTAEGDELAVIDATAWTANLAEAENRLESAELTLLRVRQEADEAEQNWRESGLDGEPDSPLVLHEPQIQAALGERNAANANRDWAERQLTYTRIRAPFNGVVIARHVSRGESILQGEPVAQMYATDAFELALPVAEEAWSNLPTRLIGATAELVASDGVGRWLARVIRSGGGIDPATRMRTLYLSVTNPLVADPPLLPGTFVTARLTGRPVDGLLELPEGVLTRKGHVWYVDDDDRLARFEAEALFSREGRVYVAEPEPRASWRIVQYPLESYMVGQAVLTRQAAEVQ